MFTIIAIAILTSVKKTTKAVAVLLIGAVLVDALFLYLFH